MNMISFQNFTPQENFNGEFPDLLNNETISAEFDAFLNLFSVVPPENNMFSGADIPEELNENPIGLQSLENPEIDTPFIPVVSNQSGDAVSDQSGDVVSEQKPSVVDEVSTALFKSESSDVTQEIVPTIKDLQIRPTKTADVVDRQISESILPAFQKMDPNLLAKDIESKTLSESKPVEPNPKILTDAPLERSSLPTETKVPYNLSDPIELFTKNVKSVDEPKPENLDKHPRSFTRRNNAPSNSG